jgi:hypothetical protein
MVPYRADMTATRFPEDFIAPRNLSDWYPYYDGPTRFYDLLPIADPMHAPRCHETTTACAEQRLRAQGDSRQPRGIFKHWLFPHWQARFGGGNAWLEGPELSAAVAIDLYHLTQKTPLPLPGRVAIEIFGGFGDKDRIYPSGFIQRTTAALTVGARYEKLTTGMFGFHVGAHKRFRRNHVVGVTPDLARTMAEAGVSIRIPGEPRWEDRGIHWTAGPLAEVPTPYGAVMVHAGPVWSGDQNNYLGFELRFSFAAWKHRGRNRFGR